MNEWQVMNQLEFLAKSLVWPGSSTKVFATESVFTSVAPAEDLIRGLKRPPMLWLGPADAQADPEFQEEPDCMSQNIDATLLALQPGDAIGRKVLLGANRTSGAASFGQVNSENRGLLEVQTVLIAGLKQLNNLSGVRIVLASRSRVGAQLDPASKYIAWRKYTFAVKCGEDLFYHPARQLAATTPGGGQVSLTWKLPPTRWDTYRMVLRRAAGSTPPASITAGTGVTLAGALSTSVVDTPGAGTWSYALFATYDETNVPASQDQRSSAAVTLTAVAT